VLNIVPTDCRVFSTKERSPFYVCMELFCPELEIEEEITSNRVISRRIPNWNRDIFFSKAQTVHVSR